MAAQGRIAPRGDLKLKVVKKPPQRMKAPLSWKLRNAPHYWSGAWKTYLAQYVSKITGCPVLISSLRLELHKADGTIIDYGVVGRRVVTTAGVGYIVDAFQNLVEAENMKYHGFGTGGAAEAVGNMALTTELTTEYATDNVRPTGTTTEGASANIYETVATLDPDSAVAITEHGIFSQAATGGGVLLDRTLFSVVNVAASGDTLQATYDLTFTSGG